MGVAVAMPVGRGLFDGLGVRSGVGVGAAKVVSGDAGGSADAGTSVAIGTSVAAIDAESDGMVITAVAGNCDGADEAVPPVGGALMDAQPVSSAQSPIATQDRAMVLTRRRP